jgi:hypothetical protein
MRAQAAGQILTLIGAICLVPSLGLTQAKLARDQLAQALQSAQPKSAGETERAGKINNWTLGLAAGTPEGTILRFTTEIALQSKRWG